MAFRMQFLSDNAASVHPRVWAAMQAADAADSPYDTDRLSAAEGWLSEQRAIWQSRTDRLANFVESQNPPEEKS